jgi:hypothetical protein
VLASGAVCGVGFRHSERLTLTASGARGTFTWTSKADAAGKLHALLPALLCLHTPLNLVVIGASGDRSNALTITSNACLPLP